MLPFRLHQIYVPSLGRYLLPLPKLAAIQLASLSAHLEAKGFDVRQGKVSGRRIARKGALRISVDATLGLAASGNDMLDVLAPAIPILLAFKRPRGASADAGIGALYFSLKRSGASAELQLFPRMESLRTWTCLRMDGMCALTPDEALVVRRLLSKASGSSRLECVTAKPREGSKAIQLGRRLYYRSTVTVADFLSSLGTIDSGRTDSASYLPRDSAIELPGVRVDTRITADELGEWCGAG